MAEIAVRGGLPFAKMSGSGNDFIIINNQNGLLEGMDLSALARKVCSRHTSVGADGLICLEESSRADFRWQFYNSDGSPAEMCGNGGRCAARFAFMEGIAPASMTFETVAGIIAAKVEGRDARIQLTRPFGYEDEIFLRVDEQEYTAAFVNTGVPHVVLIMDDIGSVNVAHVGRFIRFHSRFQPAGTNVNFASVTDRANIRLRTYERGVEAETMACGTGSVATALTAWKKGMADDIVKVKTSGGETLTVYIKPEKGKEYPNISLEGRTILVCRGVIDPEAYN